ncbi:MULTISPECIES: PadR family transcriptional regulator [Paenibacillus]|uniref:PadR family transcriptional regulator n=1 Tax=Paenibacillus TaxID=44249 RepID=UPI001143B434|nr:PadR family transcriptional regulator [Paenibacillus sp. tmac-D7]
MSMKLVILGLLMENDSHPYQMRQKMKERGMLHYIKMQEGSLYYAIDTLAKADYVKAIETIKHSAGRPDRTVYRITESGRRLFQELLDKQFAENKAVYHPMYAALAFAKHGDPKRIHDLLQGKLEEQRKLAASLRELYDSHIDQVPRAVLHMMKGRLEHAEIELRWLERLAEDALNDRLKEYGKPIED